MAPSSTARPKLALVPTGVANVASLRASFSRLGCELSEVKFPEEIVTAEAVVLPGVGAFAPGIASLREREFDAALVERIGSGNPTLAVCLGLQLLAASSHEAPGERGLGILDVPVERFPADVVCPQLGWNAITADGSCQLLESGWVAFANSFRLTERPEGWCTATANHGGEFVAAVERGPILGCQFHPELSGSFGQRLLGRWLASAGINTRPAARAAVGGVA